MHGASVQLSTAILERIVALTMFGDPGNRGPNETSPLGGQTPVFPPILANRLKENCAPGDPVCSNSGTDYLAHLSYGNGTYIPNSAEYIVRQYSSHGRVGPEPASFGGPANGDAPAPTAANIAALQALATLLGAPPGQRPA
jgi:Cutinase